MKKTWEAPEINFLDVVDTNGGGTPIWPDAGESGPAQSTVSLGSTNTLGM